MYPTPNQPTTNPQKVRVAIIGVGNCASSLAQDVEYYKTADPNAWVPGLINPTLGPYRIRDIEFTAGFDVNETKVGRPLAEAIFAGPNNTHKFTEVPVTEARVHRGPLDDGLGKYLKQAVPTADRDAENVVQILKDTGTHIVVSYLPVGSELASRWYAERVLEAGCGFVNCIPVFIASDKDWRKRFEQRGLPLIGDDVKSQVGATIVHRVLTNLFRERGVQLDRTYQLNFGGQHRFLEHARAGTAGIEKDLENPSRVEPAWGSTDAGAKCPRGTQRFCPVA
jgi:myo-inositol-1-phosphate synthase